MKLIVVYHILLEYTNGIYYHRYTNGIYRGGEMICMENQSVNIFRDKDGQNVVLINDIKFRTRRIVVVENWV